jgi:hypothetical protein
MGKTKRASESGAIEPHAQPEGSRKKTRTVTRKGTPRIFRDAHGHCQPESSVTEVETEVTVSEEEYSK